MKKLLIISPYFPPSNAADMQRIRMSLPYFRGFEWEVEVITVDPEHSDMDKDERLVESIPADIKIHYVKALSKKWTSKIGLGSIALRSLWFYREKVDQLLKNDHFDLIYFSTTQFPICILGSYWKKKFGIPYVIDMQDPWHSDYYEDKPKSERPKKYWFSYRLNKYLEPLAMKQVDGLISVSQAYIDTLATRYHRIRQIPSLVITFGAFEPDFDVVKKNHNSFQLPYLQKEQTTNLVYIGRGGHDMKPALTLLFTAFKKGLERDEKQFNQIRFHFIGTSYAPKGQGIPTIKPIATEMGIGEYVHEQTDRISFYDSIYTLLTANILLIIGSDDPQYTASKLYPYILAKRPLLAIFHPASSAAKIIKETNAGVVVPLVGLTDQTIEVAYHRLLEIVEHQITPSTNWKLFEPYTAKNMTKSQVELFNNILETSK